MQVQMRTHTYTHTLLQGNEKISFGAHNSWVILSVR